MNTHRSLKALTTSISGLLLAGVIATTPAAGAAKVKDNRPEVTLKDHGLVNGDGINLSDVFSGVPTDLDIKVSNSPAPGKSARFTPGQLRQLADQFGLSWRPLRARPRIVIDRASKAVPMVSLRRAIEEELRAAHVEGEVEVEISRLRVKPHVASESEISISVRDLSYDDRAKRFAALVSVSEDSSRLFKISGRAYSLISIPVTVRHVTPGEIIKASDIAWRSVRTFRSNYNSITDPEMLIGFKVRRPIIAGKVIRRTDVTPNILVPRGELVTIQLKTQFMRLTTRGKALDAGARGDTIRVRNTKSNKIVEARVVGPGVVSIQRISVAALN